MRIGLVHLPGGLGAAIRCSAMIRNLRASGHEVLEIPLQERGAPGFLPDSFHVLNLLSLGRRVFRGRFRALGAEIAWNNALRSLCLSIPRWVRQILEVHRQVDLFQAETCLPAYLCALVQGRTGKPFIFDMHGLQVEEAGRQGESPGRIRFWRKAERISAERAERILVVSRAMAEFILGRHGVSSGRLLVVPNGTEPYPRKARYARPRRVIYGGVFHYYERVEDFLRAAQLLAGREWEFILMGDGRLRNEIFDYVNRHSIDLIYLGRKSRPEALKQFSRMQIGVAPSTKDLTRRVASPIKVLDYAACGLPVVTVDVGEWSNLIRDYEAGVVVPESDPKELAAGIAQLGEESRWRRASENALRMVREACRWQKTLGPLLDFYGGRS